MKKSRGYWIKKGGIILMAIIGSLSQTGCGKPTKEQAEKIIVEKLEKKYDEPFVIDEIGGHYSGLFYSNIVQAICYPEADSTLRFVASMDTETKEVYDFYLNRLVGRNEEPTIKKIADEIWGDSYVTVHNDTRSVYPTEVDRKMTNKEFLELYPENCQVVQIYIKGEESIENEEDEFQKMKNFSEKLIAIGYKSTYISVIYLKPQIYSRCFMIEQQEYSIRAYLDDNEVGSQYCALGLEINEKGERDDKEREIKQWKENMSNYHHWGE